MKLDLKTWAIIGVVVALSLLVFFTCGRSTRDRQAADNANAGRTIAEGQAGAARDAQGRVIQNSERELARRDLDRRNADAIDAAKGSTLDIGPDVGDAGRASLCLRDSTRGDPTCKRLLHPRPG